MLLRRAVAATTKPVSLADARAHLRVDGTDEDVLIDGILAAAVQQVGEMAGRSLSPEQWDVSDRSFSGDLVLPKSPVTALVSVKYYDASDVQQTATLSDFYLFQDDDRSIVRPKANAQWPTAGVDRADGVTVRFTAGYTTIPAGLKSAVLLMLGHLMENREAVGNVGGEIPLGVESLVNAHRLGWAAA